MNTEKTSQEYTGAEGDFITSAEAARLTTRFHEKKKERGHKVGSYTEAQFFGKNQLKKLMDREECAGLRFYFAASEDPQISEQLVIVAVDGQGRDLTATRIGLKDMPERGRDALTSGPCCPTKCNP